MLVIRLQELATALVLNRGCCWEYWLPFGFVSRQGMENPAKLLLKKKFMPLSVVSETKA